MKILGSSKSKITKDKIREDVFHLEITEVILAHWNIANSYYQQNSGGLYLFVPQKSFGQLLDI